MRWVTLSVSHTVLGCCTESVSFMRECYARDMQETSFVARMEFS